MVLYHMWAIGFGSPEAVWFRGTHLLFAMVLTFLIFRATGKTRGHAGPARSACCWCSASRRSSICLYNYDYVVNRIFYVDDLYLERQDHGRASWSCCCSKPCAACSAGRCRSPRSSSSVYGLFIAQARAAAPARPALHDDRRHLRHSALGVGDLCADLRGVRHLHGAHRHRAIVHGLRHRPDRPRHRRARQGGGGVVRACSAPFPAARSPTSWSPGRSAFP